MNFNVPVFRSVLLLGILSFALCFGAEDIPGINGVLGVSPVENETALAIWVELDPGASVSGISWFNNDENSAFPSCSAKPGVYGDPGLVSEATLVGSVFYGEEAGWSILNFLQPVTTMGNGMYVFFELPPGDDFVAEGDGFGVGYYSGEQINNCWITENGGSSWVSFTSGIQLAIHPIISTDKTNALVLENPVNSQDGRSEQVLPKIKIKVSPNPFNPETQIWFNVPESGYAQVKVFDARGYLVKTPFEGNLAAGDHIFEWTGKDENGRDVPSGVYFVSLNFEDTVISQRCTLLK